MANTPSSGAFSASSKDRTEDSDNGAIILEDIALRRGQKLLFFGVSATLQPEQKIALIGGNGYGKSSLFALLLEELQADAGDIRGIKRLRISHMA